MSVLVSHEVKDTIYSSFGSTLQEAESNADKLAVELTAKGNLVRKDALGAKLRDDLYGWNLIVKKNRYS